MKIKMSDFSSSDTVTSVVTPFWSPNPPPLAPTSSIFFIEVSLFILSQISKKLEIPAGEKLFATLYVKLVLFLLFIIFFYGSRTYVFYDKKMEVTFNNNDAMVRIKRPGFIFGKTEKLPFSAISSVEMGGRTFTPDNPDGVAFVEKISAQHGSFIPGLGEEQEFVTISLMLTDGTERLIFAGHIGDEPEIPLRKIRSHLGMKGM